MADRNDRVFHVPDDLAGQTLAAVLRRVQPGLSWSETRRLLSGRRVMIDGNLAGDGGRRMKPGEVLKVLAQGVTAPATASDVQIRYLDPDVVVVEKPSGMTSIRHPEERHWPARRRQLQPTLTDLLPRVVATAERARRGAQRAVRAVHRLDRDTSGLMVFARNTKAERFLGSQFRQHTIRRVYLAVAAGRVEAATIDTLMVADRGDGRRGTAPAGSFGKRAITHVRPIEYFAGCTLVECRLETGRTHQIRIHLAEVGHAVCGDKVYGPPSAGGKAVPRPPRLALHAARLGFVHPDGRSLDFESPLPDDLAQFLRVLRGGKGPSRPPDGPRSWNDHNG